MYNLSSSIDENVTAILSETKLNELLESKRFNARFGMYTVVKLNKRINFDFERVIGLFYQ